MKQANWFAAFFGIDEPVDEFLMTVNDLGCFCYAFVGDTSGFLSKEICDGRIVRWMHRGEFIFWLYVVLLAWYMFDQMSNHFLLAILLSLKWFS